MVQRRWCRGALFGILAVAALASHAEDQRLTGWQPGSMGTGSVVIKSPTARVGNGAIIGVINLKPGPKWTRLEDRWAGRTLGGGAPIFRIRLADGTVRDATQFTPVGAPTAVGGAGRPIARRLAERQAWSGLKLDLRDPQTGLSAVWQLTTRNQAAYLRAELTLTAGKRDVPITEVELIDLPTAGGQVAGTAPGSPITLDGWFLGVEHPTSTSTVEPKRVRARLDRRVPLRAGNSFAVSAVMGLAPAGQTRRAFAAYLNAERARPYAPFLHYNSWYDIGYFQPYTQRDALNRIAQYGEQLVRRRGVPVASYLFDDGWDDTATVWEFNEGFPQGFRPLRTLAAEYGGAPGAWLSPWGGYGRPREQRLTTGRAAGMEVDAQGYALSGPKYYDRFRQVCRELVEQNGVNHFKFDGTGSPDKQTPGSAYDSDFAAAIDLINDLRGRRPNLFVNLTTGTWPSPFWTRIADSIWRGGSDHSFAGPGTQRQQWITYRDADTFRGVVRPGPLYPLNSLMLHGLIYAQHAGGLNTDPGGDFDDEIWSYFGSGTQLQEMYITPNLLQPGDWDTLAAAARWSLRQADALADVHWVGGDPGQQEVYGWAGWSPRASVLTLRNPSGEPQSYALDLAAALELPGRPRGERVMRRVNGTGSLSLPLGGTRVVDLAPFEVLVLEGGGQ